MSENGDIVIYFDSFGVEHIPKEIKKFMGNKIIPANTYIIQTYVSVIYGYFGIGFIRFMVKGKMLLYYTDLFSPNKYEKNYKKMLKHIQ